ncbi:heme-binding protein [Frigidibacter sp. MR17.14]|uniref:GlcG/HbpS family heme-binding protein n=1 Tax=Frigidibacter sp. MR17.14 TaxID=3126509 RepID=UPI003012F3FE
MSFKHAAIAFTLLSLRGLPALADAAPQPVLTLTAAQEVLQAAVAKADAEGWPGVVAVTDAGGALVAFLRMDDAAVPAGVTLAPGKARTAALFARPTADLEAAINGPRPAVVTAGDFVMMKGGLPLRIDGRIVGAIGVSADTPDHDQAIAEAGMAALTR